MASRHRTPKSKRIGRVTLFPRGNRIWVYYRQDGRQIRRSLGDDWEQATALASQVNAELAQDAPTSLGFRQIDVQKLIVDWLEYHESVRRSSLATVRRYRAAITHFSSFVEHRYKRLQAHRCTLRHAEEFVKHLRQVKVAPNGHAHTKKRALRDKGVIFILETCRSLFSFAAKRRCLPPYAPNPFSCLSIDRMPIEDSKVIQPMSAEQEVAFFKACDDWQFPVFFVLAFTGLRIGELTHLLIDQDVAPDWSYIRVSNKPQLGWQVKTRNQRTMPLLPQVGNLLRRTCEGRTCGPVFLRRRFLKGEVLPVLVRANCRELETGVSNRVASSTLAHQLSRIEISRIARSVWRDAGAVKETTVRTEFMKVTRRIGLVNSTCPKDMRHLFATSLQAAGVDPMLRRDLMGHTTLAMTSRYTHPESSTVLREVARVGDVRGQALELGQERLLNSFGT